LAGVVMRQIATLVQKPSGRGEHSVFACPLCAKPHSVLYSGADLRLSCAGCSGYRTRRQKEASRSDWEENGHALEDRLFRGVMRKGHTPTKICRLRAVVDELVNGDHDRLASAMQTTSAALHVADAEINLAAH